jgi:hypothetical protein
MARSPLLLRLLRQHLHQMMLQCLHQDLPQQIFMLHKHFGHQRRLPITHQEKRESDSSATIYKVKTYAPHNKLLQLNT